MEFGFRRMLGLFPPTPLAGPSFATALFPFYQPVKVVPAQPGRRRSTALAQP